MIGFVKEERRERREGDREEPDRLQRRTMAFCTGTNPVVHALLEASSSPPPTQGPRSRWSAQSLSFSSALLAFEGFARPLA